MVVILVRKSYRYKDYNVQGFFIQEDRCIEKCLKIFKNKMLDIL